MTDNTGWTTVTHKKEKKEMLGKQIIKKNNNSYYQEKTTILRKRYKPINKKTAIREGNIINIKRSNPDAHRLYKISEERENFTHKKISFSFRTELKKERISKNMTQEELANAINVKKNIIIGYENGTIIPNIVIISKLKNILKISKKK